jgi:hypothetical protein
MNQEHWGARLVTKQTNELDIRIGAGSVRFARCEPGKQESWV